MRALPLWANLAAFAVAAVVVWRAGARLARDADAIAERTRLGGAFVGAALLAVVTGLPEAATSVTASLEGNPELSLHNLFGGVVLQTAMLVFADARIREGPLTYVAPRPALILQGIALVLLLAGTLVAVVLEEPIEVGPVGLGAIALALVYGGTLWAIHRHARDAKWRPIDVPDVAEHDRRGDVSQSSMRHIALTFTISALLILGAGVVLSTAADAIAEQSGIGVTMVGATMLAGATSLPELATTLTAVRVRAYSLAIGNVLGSNATICAFVLLSDAAHAGEPILRLVDRAGQLSLCAGIVVTCVYLAGLVERANRSLLRLGWDSWVVALATIAFLLALATLS